MKHNQTGKPQLNPFSLFSSSQRFLPCGFPSSAQEHIIDKPTSDINQLDLADGLKESLIKYGFDLEALLNTTPERTAEVLGIELDVAKIIHVAAVMKHYRTTSPQGYSLSHRKYGFTITKCCI